MKLTTSKGQLALPADFSFSIQKESPFSGNSGTATIPVTLPASQETLHRLGRPERLGSPTSFLRKIPAKLEAGIVHKDGVLVVDTLSLKGGIVASLAMDESDLYAQWKEKKLPEIFEGLVRTDIVGVDAWVRHLMSCAAGGIDDWFTIATVAVNKSEEDGVVSYQYLNEPDVSSSASVWPLVYGTRTIVENGADQVLPSGYGVAPFLYLGKFLKLLMEQMGYTLRANPFSEDPVLAKIILLHSAADSICGGYLKISDIVPTCTLSEFLEFLNGRFHAQVFVYPEQKVADIVLFEDMLTGSPDVDLTKVLDGEVQITYPDPKQISLEVGTVIDEADPAEKTFHQLAKKYPVCHAVSELSFSKEGLYGCVLRKALGRFYRYTFNNAEGQYIGEHIGTNNFNYCLDTLPKESIKAADAVYGMISYCPNASYPTRPIVSPYIGEKRHPSGCYQLPETGEDQDIILAFAPGLAESSGAITAGYYLATNQKYNNIGTQWNEWGLNFADMYSRFWKGYNSLLQNSAFRIKGKFDYRMEQLVNLRMDRLKFFLGQKLIMDSIGYSIGDSLKCEDSCYTVIPNLLFPIEDPVPEIREQTYKWKLMNNINEVLREWSDPRYTVKRWEYEEEFEDLSDTFPTPIEMGLTRDHQEVAIKVYLEKTTQVEVLEEVETVMMKVWYQSVPD